MMINPKSTDSVPTLEIDGNQIKLVVKVKYLGDVVNNKGDNTSLIEDRVNKGNAVIINSVSLCSEVSVGKHGLSIWV